MITTETDCQKSLRIAQERADRLSDRCHQMGAEINVLAAQTAELRAENADLRARIQANEFLRALTVARMGQVQHADLPPVLDALESDPEIRGRCSTTMEEV